MRIRFQADADLDGRILRGLRRVAPEVDVRTAAEAGRVLISQDRNTMPRHFQRFVSRLQSPGVDLLVHSWCTISCKWDHSMQMTDS